MRTPLPQLAVSTAPFSGFGGLWGLCALCLLSAACGNPAPVQGGAGSGGGTTNIGFGNGSGTAATSGAATGAGVSGSTGASASAGQTSGTGGASSASAGATTGALPAVPNPYDAGPYFTQSDDAEVTNSVTGDTVPIHALFPPTAPAGSCPVVVFAHGFLMDASDYDIYASHLASYGYVVVLPNYPNSQTSPNHVAYARDLMSGLTWARGTEIESSPQVTALVNPALAGISGHSLGGKLAVMAAAENPGTFQASIDFDPVDGAPFGCDQPSDCPNAAPLLAGLPIPTAFLGETTDQGPTIFGLNAPCAAANANFQVFYSAAQSPSLSGDVNTAGDASFLDSTNACFEACSTCTNAAQATTVGLSHAMMVAFYERHLRNKIGYDAWLAGPGNRVGALAQSAWVSSGELLLSGK